jgi:peptidoglycan/LPS O-acetylase OafA/YrhL
MIISPVFAGKGRLIRYLLGGYFWVPLARLTFSTYLIHLLIFEYYMFTERTTFYISAMNVMHLYFATLFFAFSMAVPFTLLSEIPFMNIEKFLLFPQKPRKIEGEQGMKLLPEYDNEKP